MEPLFNDEKIVTGQVEKFGLWDMKVQNSQNLVQLLVSEVSKIFTRSSRFPIESLRSEVVNYMLLALKDVSNALSLEYLKIFRRI